MAVRWAIVVAVAGVLAALLTGCGSSSNVQSYTPSTVGALPSRTPTATPTTSAAPTTAAPATTVAVKATPTEIRSMSLCQALIRGRDAVGFIVYPNSAAAACQSGAAGATVLRLCDAIYDGSTGQLRTTSDGRKSDEAVVAACPQPTAAPTPSAAPGTQSGPAPLSSARSGTWWQAASAGSAIANLWYFDPTGSGATREYRASGAGGQQAFAYQSAAGTVLMVFSGGVQRSLRVLSYDAASDALTVQLDGATQQWVGCGSSQMPAAARATCR